MDPFVKVTINGIDLSSAVKSMNFEDDTEKDGFVKFDFKTDDSFRVLDEDICEKDKVTFQFGILGGKVSKVFHYVVSDIEALYMSDLTVGITCIDGGSFLKKETFSKNWLNTTASDIAATIAYKHNLKAVIEKTTTKYQGVMQSDKTDQEFLEYLAAKEPGGAWKVRIEGNTLYFGKRDYKKPARKKYTWNRGDGGVIKFRPVYKETKNDASTSETVVKGIDPMNKEAVTSKIVDDVVATGKKVVQYTVNGDYKGVKEIVVPESSQAALDGMANSNTQDAKKKVLTAELETYPDPTVLAGDLLTMEGVHKKHSGNWYIKKVSHKIAGNSAYTMTQELERNASKSAFDRNSKDAINVNNTVGSDNPAQLVPVRTYDVNGNETTVSTQQQAQ